jgi:hypothetical protein
MRMKLVFFLDFPRWRPPHHSAMTPHAQLLDLLLSIVHPRNTIVYRNPSSYCYIHDVHSNPSPILLLSLWVLPWKGYGLWGIMFYGLWTRISRLPSRWTKKGMGYEELWVIPPMGYERFDCIEYLASTAMSRTVYSWSSRTDRISHSNWKQSSATPSLPDCFHG